MTIDALPRKARRSPKAQEHGAIPIGENDADIFDCPTCARPLAVGSSRCPGCRTRLIARVQASRAIGFMVGGLVVGLLVGGGSLAALGALSRPLDATAAAVPIASAVPAATSAAVPIASVAPVQAPQVPSAALSVLVRSAQINERLALDAARLATALAAPVPSTADLSRTLRTLASNAAFGARIAPDLAAWSQGSSLATGLTEFYASIGSIAHEGLAASLANTAAHVAAAQQMLVVIDGLAGLDARARVLASQADVDLPPVTLPAASSASAAPASQASQATP